MSLINEIKQVVWATLDNEYGISSLAMDRLNRLCAAAGLQIQHQHIKCQDDRYFILGRTVSINDLVYELDATEKLRRTIATVLPGAEIGTDNDGQLIIYTNIQS